ncbi:BTB and MATH domain-containing protein 15-like [Mytilus trossulus]|uniref:BTB and MATH domain-containing protein 15-like n=1 Tax=Mytilus trossulus TaxID=6551 RepID=UPI003005E022
MTAKRIKTENVVEESKPAFQFTDFIIKVGNEKFYVNKRQLMAESPVFLAMLTGNFKEKDTREIDLPEKDPTAFSHFLRHTLPGFKGLILPEKTAHLILPLAHEYQTKTTLLKIDEALAASVDKKEYKNGNELVAEILEAEFYERPRYLHACIKKAYTHSYSELSNALKFDCISSDTKFTVLSKRCEKLESGISQYLYELKNITKSLCYNCKLSQQGRINEAANALLGK